MIAAKKEGQGKSDWITLATVVACVAVVFLHTNGCFWQFSTSRYWITANIIESCFYFAVPCFFMITGATLMDYRDRYSLKRYFEKRAKKTLIPFLAWSMIGVAYHVAVKDIQLSDISILYIWNGIVKTTIVPYYWYFTTLFGIYLSIPLFAAVNKEYRKEVFSYAVIVCFLLGGVIPLLNSTLLKGFEWYININAASGYLLYVLAGYLIYTYDISYRKRTIIYIFSIVGLLLHMLGTYALSIEAGEIVDTFKGYNNAPCIMYSVGIMVWLKYHSDIIVNNRIIRKLTTFIAPYTLSIYLLQFFVISVLIKLFDINTTHILYRIGSPLVIIPVAIIITWFIRKIPYLRIILP